MIFKNCLKSKDLLNFIQNVEKSKLSSMIFVKNDKGEIVVQKVGNISKEDIFKKLELKEKNSITKLPIPLESLMYPKHDSLMKSASTTLLNEMKGRVQKLGEIIINCLINE